MSCAKRPGVEFMPPQVVDGWVKQRQGFMAQPGFSKETNERFMAERRKLLKALHDAGVDIALGSDAVQTFSVPGFSIHNEMGAMARSGLTPYQIYVTGSRNVARFFNREKDAGTYRGRQDRRPRARRRRIRWPTSLTSPSRPAPWSAGDGIRAPSCSQRLRGCPSGPRSTVHG